MAQHPEGYILPHLQYIAQQQQQLPHLQHMAQQSNEGQQQSSEEEETESSSSQQIKDWESSSSSEEEDKEEEKQQQLQMAVVNNNNNNQYQIISGKAFPIQLESIYWDNAHSTMKRAWNSNYNNIAHAVCAPEAVHNAYHHYRLV